MSETDVVDVDVIVIGAGFAGMYALHRLRDELGLRVVGVERGTGVGGTWYWNRYPGARCDVESLWYSYSFSEELEQEWSWSERFATQPEILAYAEHVADRFDLRRDILFSTDVRRAEFDDASSTWTVHTADGRTLSARFLLTALGNLSAAQVPRFPGASEFAGRTFHTGAWPHEGVDFTGRRVAVIGTGSSGIQAIPHIAAEAAHLFVLQRTPAFSVPARNRPLAEEELADVKRRYRELRALIHESPAGLPVPPSTLKALELSPAEARSALEERWARGGGWIASTFADNLLSEEANAVTADFVRERIRELVHDPETAESLIPRDYPIGAKRICVDTDYYATFNRDDVTLVDVRRTPIERIIPAGVVVGGREYQVDDLVFATGYDAFTGPLDKIDIIGSGGMCLRDKWSEGPITYLGIATAGFPNLLILTGPGSPSVLANAMPVIEQHVEWACALVDHARRHGLHRVEAQPAAEAEWTAHVGEIASRTILMKAASWYLGANVPGKPRVFVPYAGGLTHYRDICDGVAADGYRGFTLTGGEDAAVA
ncbi:NAD(P)/FAD-dependent oxidoreductase [Pseudonocardia halophobica]|uniref:Cyclohexanone monooxygenase n=1 Tax=Pseudonocardia halophobica TaxID=29401 RepID=A0A9W6KYZ1_9PSEU|nr:NAD(P)/FAD-dependent oxidoreductase [Pseudonocardia halophobica]GLL10591.1 cyclohexanone monooxygenase [Pseudonocardia halophobica]